MSLKRRKSRNAAERREVWTQKCGGEPKRECGGSASGPSLYINVTSGSLAGGAQELRHREASGGGSGAPSIPQPALSLLITGRRTGNMMEDADKTTAEEIQMNPTEKSSSGCTTACFFFSSVVNHRPVIDSFWLR